MKECVILPRCEGVSAACADAFAAQTFDVCKVYCFEMQIMEKNAYNI